MLKWIVDEGAYLDDTVIDDVASKGDMEMIKWLREKGCSISSQTTINAAKGGHFELVKWFHELGLDAPARVIFDAAIKRRDMMMMEWFFEIYNKLYATPSANKKLLYLILNKVSKVFNTGDLPLIKRFMEITGFDMKAYQQGFGFGGNIEVAEWMHENGYIKDKVPDVYWTLARKGDLNGILWMQKRYPLSAEIKDGMFEAAISKGHLHVMKWVVDKKLVASDFYYAIGSDNPEILVWLKEMGCPYDKYVIAQAAMADKMVALQWLVANDYHCDSDAKISTYNLEIIVYLRSIGHININIDVEDAVINNNIELLVWYKKTGGEFVDAIFKYTGNKCVPELRNWCLEHDYIRNKAGFKSAVKYDNVELLEEYIQYHLEIDAESVFEEFMKDMLYYARKYDSWAIMRYIARKFGMADNHILMCGINSGGLDIIKWGFNEGYVLRGKKEWLSDERYTREHIKRWIKSVENYVKYDGGEFTITKTS
jgi:hypothetical protein